MMTTHYFELDPDNPEKIVVKNWNKRFKEVYDSVPTSGYRKKGDYYQFNKTWPTILALKDTFKSNLEIGPELRKWIDDTFYQTIQPSLYLRSMLETEGYEELLPHQRADAAFLTVAQRAVLANGMGTGKSRSAMAGVRLAYEQGHDVFPVLIVCPNSTKIAWGRDEVEAVWPGLRVGIVDGSPAQKRKILANAMKENPCPIHSVTQKENTTQKGSVETATKETLESATQSTQSGSDKTAKTGLNQKDSYLHTNDISKSATGSPQSNTESILNEQTTPANFVQDQPQYSTTATTQEKLEGSSVDTATSPSKEQKKTTRGSKKLECTCPYHVLIMNWEAVKSYSKLKSYGSHGMKRCVECGGVDPKTTASACEAHEKELNKIDFNTVIGDEIHRIKDPSAKTTRAFKAATGDAAFRFGLSGTPIADSPADYWSILNWLFPEAYTAIGHYRDRFCETEDNMYGPPTVVGIKESKKTEFFAGIDPFLRRMPKELIMKFLPPIMPQVREVEMNPKQKKAYEQMREKMISEVHDDVLSAGTGMMKAKRLLQFASSYGEVSYVETLDAETGELYDKAVLTLGDPSCKIDAFVNDIDDFGDESVVVFAPSKQLINLLSNRLDKLHIKHGLITGDQDPNERQMYMDAFQNGQIQFILCTTAAGGTGITLTKGSIAVFLQRPFSMIENEQAEARVHRFGSQQHESIQIIDYITKDTIEYEVLEKIQAKKDQLEDLLRDKQFLLKFLGAKENE